MSDERSQISREGRRRVYFHLCYISLCGSMAGKRLSFISLRNNGPRENGKKI